jgi:hypothetical protein
MTRVLFSNCDGNFFNEIHDDPKEAAWDRQVTPLKQDAKNVHDSFVSVKHVSYDRTQQ